MSISVVILTLNEEANIAACIEALSWCDDIVVFDSYSQDQTVEIARAHGARVVQRVFDNYAAQRNAAIKEVAYKHEWLLMVDADERWPASMSHEMWAAVADNNGITLYHFLRKDMFMGRWIKRSSGYPTWAGRLMKISEAAVSREINEEYHTTGRKGYLKAHYEHFPFNKGIAHWFERHNRYSSNEAVVIARERSEPLAIRDFASTDPAVRRKAQKRLVGRLPFRPAVMFVALYLVRGGFLDGRAGFHYSVMKAMYEYMIALKIREAARKKAGLPV